MTREVEVAIIGAGPAGLSAAIEASKAGAKGIIIDENNRAGGQLFKQIHKFFGSRAHQSGTRGFDIGRNLLNEVQALGCEVMLETVAWGIFENNTISIYSQKINTLIAAKRILLATGASENIIAFPGWTLPGVMGAGAIQTLINIHRVLPGKRVLMIGSGNVGLIVSYQLLQAGAKVLAIIEALPQISGYTVHASKIARAGVPILTGHTIKEAMGTTKVDKASIIALDHCFRHIPGTEREIDVDVICLACGLSPLAELAWLAGCRFTFIPELGGFLPVHDSDMQTTVHGIYIAGDIAGIEEASTAIEEGRLAGISIAESLGYLSELEAKKKKLAIVERIMQLREGPLGRKKREAKEVLMRGSQ
ncbi:MAG: FAD-dependent oxidoreductase [Planctomycetes bacterium]|nr:FAD-dependent oxidoreductase [Planctomycetota bacterium]